MPDKTTLQIIIEAVDKLSGPSAKMRKSLDELEVAAKRITQVTGLDKVGAAYTAVDRSINRVQYRARSMFSEFTRFSAMSAGVGYLLYNQFVKPAAEMERFGVQFGQLTKSSDEAKTAMSWVKDFAFRTPQSIRDTAQAFIDLRKQGIDPTKGALLAASNFAATTNRDFGEVVQNIGRAALGRARGLVDLGITANPRKGEGMVQYTTTNTATGQLFNSPVIDMRKRQLQAQTIVDLLNLSYAGGAAKQMQTVEGSINRIGKMWQFFRLQVADAGVFKYVKTQVNQIADRLTAMFVSGEMQQWAQKTSDAIVGLMQGVVKETPGILTALGHISSRTNTVVGFFGGWGNVLEDLADIQMVRFGASVLGLGKDLVGLALAMAKVTGGAELMVAGLAVAGTAYVLKKAQDEAAEARAGTQSAMDRLGAIANGPMTMGENGKLRPQTFAEFALPGPAVAPFDVSHEPKRGKIEIHLQSDVPITVGSVHTEPGSDFDFLPNLGLFGLATP